MIMARRAKKKLGFVDDTISKPTTDSHVEGACNDLVSSRLINSTIPEIRSKILYTGTKIRKDLKDHFF